MTAAAVKDLFWRALELPESERAAFLDGACAGDADLRARVDKLLDAHDHADTVLQGAAQWRDDSVDLGPGDVVGPYRLVERLGEGGFGVVFLAEQDQPVRRQVALKIVKLGMDTASVVGRFQLERQALASMDHPNIARVFDAGSTQRGRPYFAMEYVDGLPITEFCVRRHEPLRRRIELLRVVCNALHHAHQKGVIHRDIKPSNILVAEVDGQPVPKLIDFGIAKATQATVALEVPRTVEGNVLGTPGYMSPEHADGAGAIDTRSDVYSMGVLLYELLTGRLPFSNEGGLLALFERIKHEDPPTPAQVLRRGRDESTTSTWQRIPPELDWITMKCIEKDPARRYRSAYALGADLGAYLEDRPVEAAPPSYWYRARKLARRHRVATMAASTVVLGTFLGVAGLAWGLAEAQRSAELTRQSALHAASEHAKVMRLAAFQQLEDLRAQVHELWPPVPERIPAMQKWLAAAEALIAGLDQPVGEVPGHLELLAQLRARAVAPPPAGGDPGSHEWRFASEEDRWWHAQLVKLIAEIRAFADPETGLLDGVSKEFGRGVRLRLAFAERVREQTIDGADARRRWDEVLAAVARAGSPYSGVPIVPRLGLLPIGPDPVTGLQEFAVPFTGEVPERDGEGRLQITADSAFVLVLLPGGSFDMGAQATDETAPNYDQHAQDDEAPVHRVAVSPFYVSKFEVTQGQWSRLRGVNPSRYHPRTEFDGKPVSLVHPVEMVSWNECVALLDQLGLRLPTEAEWEYAARAGTATAWWSGNDPWSLTGAANLADAAATRAGANWPAVRDLPGFDDGWPAHSPVDALRPNPFGLHDMVGNVAEWCGDGYLQPYPAGPTEDPFVAPESSSTRTNRGGTFALSVYSSRASNRDPLSPDSRLGSLGFRPALDLLPD